MEIGTQQAREALQAISRAEATVRQHSLNNGVVPLVWGLAVFAMMLGFDIIPRLFSDPNTGLLVSGSLLAVVPIVTAFWTARYQRLLPVQPLRMDLPRLFTYWGGYHATVLFGGMTLGTHFWHLHCMRPGTWSLIGFVDAAPLLWVGFSQRRRTQGARP